MSSPALQRTAAHACSAYGQAPARTNLLALPRAELAAFFRALGEKPFRATQVMRWMHHRGVTDFEAMTDVAKALRARLSTLAEIRPPEVVDEHVSADGTRKWAVAVGDDNHIETVFIPERERGTLCISSQVGCALDCSFCATGKQGFNRNLTAAEILGQVWQATRRLEGLDFGRDKAITNVVLMGMGEPLLNFDAVAPALDVILDDLGYGVSKRRLTLSTAGVVPGIYRLAEVADVALAISLHAPDDALRDELVPINRKYPIAELLDACEYYLSGLGERRSITFEYTLLHGVNDSGRHAERLAARLERMRGGCKINLIPFNPFPGSGYARPDLARVRAFQEYLMARGFATMVRTTRGEDIDAACGQLAGEFADRTQRRARYIARLRDAGSEASAVS